MRTIAEQVERCKAWAQEHYEQGAHWVYETWDNAQYEAHVKAHPKAPIKALKRHVASVLEQESNTRFE